MTKHFYKLTIFFIALNFTNINCHSGSQSAAKSVAILNEASKGPDTNKVAANLQPELNVARSSNTVPLKNMFGINAYEWNFLENPGSPNDRKHIYEDNMKLVDVFSSVRHYLNWNRLETTKRNYTFNPTDNGGWNEDIIYQRCKQDGILVLADLKNIPEWLQNTYPASSRDNDNAPTPYGQSLNDPASYTDQAAMAFQLAARYGYNKNIDKNLVKVDGRKRYPGDIPNKPVIGMGVLKYVECGNERDKWWGGDETHQTPEQYAANLSAFYDGNMGKLGPGVGVKAADPNMQVVMGGLATADYHVVQKIINWCKTNRGLKKDGSINLCFDVLNFHLYSNNGDVRVQKKPTTGIAPELSVSAAVAKEFVNLANSLPQKPEVWVTETGYDINPESYQRAESIGSKTVLASQADWILRTSLLYIRYGIKRVFYYQLFDDHPGGKTQYATSGLAEGIKRRPAADYILQTTRLMGNYNYIKTLSSDPLVDEYKLADKTMYVLTIPDETGRKANYTLDLGNAEKAIIHTLKIGADIMSSREVNAVNGKIQVEVTETPVFVEGVNR
ncbi:hypothetical protein [Mucilaginibacter sp. L3T2-6]|uniref:hypothetical protein n=1 Tax=Mucilaginibacter sp. L3T2-6 TaxID=3062491 RepID=UPI002675A6AF|nr:hypothetical protein [Mucilaginibacter sp. L3T2-6]MDO3644117.1 hypothetical protein [Mucilaginibacter sp. L3T2-6]MDV6216602.1 hypothetical protein [Mucilaginibacter sp. L3T2-6]